MQQIAGVYLPNLTVSDHMMSMIGNKRVATVRKPSPSRDDDAAEETFQSKLEEIKKMRSQINKPEECPINPPLPSSHAGAKTVMTVNGAKTFLKSFGDWVEVVSKSGNIYYYNKRSLVNQWKKPQCWLEEEERLNAPPPPLPPPPPAEPPAQPPPPDDKLRLKLMTLKKIQRLKNPDSTLPLAYQKSKRRLDDSSSDEEDGEKKSQKLTVETAFEDPDQEDQDQRLAKLDPEDEIGHLKPEPIVEEPKVKSAPDEVPDVEDAEMKRDLKDCRKFDPRVSGPERAENLMEGCAAQLAFKNISRIPEASNLLANSSEAALPGNPTFFTEYNLPCCLRRCKFPKEQDVLHELKLNKLKKRTFLPPPVLSDLDPKLSHLAREAQMDQFMAELKNYNNHDRLMTNRMDNVLVYKIPDEVWERYFYLFQVELFDGVYLECKPSGYTHNDELVYSRTGKICGHRTFPEDEVRCQAVLQVWDKAHCLCMYANTIFKIKRDDELWKDILYECKRFLERNGY